MKSIKVLLFSTVFLGSLSIVNAMEVDCEDFFLSGHKRPRIEVCISLRNSQQEALKNKRQKIGNGYIQIGNVHHIAEQLEYEGTYDILNGYYDFLETATDEEETAKIIEQKVLFEELISDYNGQMIVDTVHEDANVQVGTIDGMKQLEALFAGFTIDLGDFSF